MATLGDSTTPSSGYFYDDVGDSQFFPSGYTMPAGGGIVTEAYVYVGGDGSTPTAKICIWGNTDLIWSSSDITLPSDGRSVGGQGWHSVSVPSVYVPAGTVHVGIWTSGDVVWTYSGSNSTYYQRSVSSPTTLSSGGTEGSGAMASYLTYTPGGIAHIYNGSSWVDGVVYVNTGTSGSPVWTPCAGLTVWNGSSWVQGS